MNHPIESELLRTFLAVVDAMNFSAAALRVGRTQSAVSAQMKKLEQAVGDSLFERGSRGVVLTRSGHQLLPYARRIIDLLGEAAVTVREKSFQGPVRIGVPEEYTSNLIPSVLTAFAARHPATEVTVSCDYTSRNLVTLDREELDLAVVFDCDDKKVGEILSFDPTVWVTSQIHRLHELSPTPVAIYRNEAWVRNFVLPSLERRDRRYRIAMMADTSLGLANAVSAGLAVASLSRSQIPPGCRELTVEDGFEPIDASKVVLIRNPHRTSDAIEGLADMLRDAFQPMRPGVTG